METATGKRSVENVETAETPSAKHIKNNNTGNIRVGRITYTAEAQKIMPKYQDFTVIEVMTASTKYGSLGPYVLKSENGCIMENIWQFSKVYEYVPYSKQRFSRFQPRTIWEHPSQTHLKSGTLTDDFWAWRKKGFFNKDPVRYPVGFEYRSKCVGALWNPELDMERNALPWEMKTLKMMDYVEARKQIYLPVYSSLVKRQPQYKELQKMLNNGENLLILEVDGPHEESLAYYQKKYNVDQNWIVDHSIDITPKNMRIMINDSKHAFGHGYCLGMTLLDPNQKWDMSAL